MKVHTYMHTLLGLPSTGLFSHNVKKRKLIYSNLIKSKIYSKSISNYFVWNILLKSVRLKMCAPRVLRASYRIAIRAVALQFSFLISPVCKATQKCSQFTWEFSVVSKFEDSNISVPRLSLLCLPWSWSRLVT